MNSRTHSHDYVCMHIYTQVPVCMYVCIYVFPHIFTYIFKRILDFKGKHAKYIYVWNNINLDHNVRRQTGFQPSKRTLLIIFVHDNNSLYRFISCNQLFLYLRIHDSSCARSFCGESGASYPSLRPTKKFRPSYYILPNKTKINLEKTEHFSQNKTV